MKTLLVGSAHGLILVSSGEKFIHMARPNDHDSYLITTKCLFFFKKSKSLIPYIYTSIYTLYIGK
jgi:hypothetical protein